MQAGLTRCLQIGHACKGLPARNCVPFFDRNAINTAINRQQSAVVSYQNNRTETAEGFGHQRDRARISRQNRASGW